MPAQPNKPTDDVWSAPESGTVRDDTSGNQTADKPGRPAPGRREKEHPDPSDNVLAPDDPSVAGEER